jgi:flagellar protein FliS
METPREVAAAYRGQDLRTAEPLRLVFSVYEFALGQLARARDALARGDAAAKGAAVSRVADCLGLLRSSLDMERGGEIARNLDRLYDYFSRRLLEAHATNRDDLFAEVAGHLGELAGAWKEVARGSSRPEGVLSREERR